MGEEEVVIPGQARDIDREELYVRLLLWITGICGDLTCSCCHTGRGDLDCSEAQAKPKLLPHIPP